MKDSLNLEWSGKSITQLQARSDRHSSHKSITIYSPLFSGLCCKVCTLTIVNYFCFLFCFIPFFGFSKVKKAHDCWGRFNCCWPLKWLNYKIRLGLNELKLKEFLLKKLNVSVCSLAISISIGGVIHPPLVLLVGVLKPLAAQQIEPRLAAFSFCQLFLERWWGRRRRKRRRETDFTFSSPPIRANISSTTVTRREEV